MKWFSRREPAVEVTSIHRPWPVGVDYLALAEPGAAKNYERWAWFKLVSAAWYRDVLHEIHAQTGRVERFYGVEMALDGFFNSSASAFDAAAAGLVQAIENRGPIPATSRVPAHHRSWPAAKRQASYAGVRLKCAAAVDAALTGDQAAFPTGWLAQVRRLRNRVMPEGKAEPDVLKIPGQPAVDPVAYVDDSFERITALVDLVLREARAIEP